MPARPHGSPLPRTQVQDLGVWWAAPPNPLAPIWFPSSAQNPSTCHPAPTAPTLVQHRRAANLSSPSVLRTLRSSQAPRTKRWVLSDQHGLSGGLPTAVPSSHRPPGHPVTHSMRQPLRLCTCSSLCLSFVPRQPETYSCGLLGPLFKRGAEKPPLFTPTKIGAPPQLSVPCWVFSAFCTT